MIGLPLVIHQKLMRIWLLPPLLLERNCWREHMLQDTSTTHNAKLRVRKSNPFHLQQRTT